MSSSPSGHVQWSGVGLPYGRSSDAVGYRTDSPVTGTTEGVPVPRATVDADHGAGSGRDPTNAVVGSEPCASIVGDCDTGWVADREGHPQPLPRAIGVPVHGALLSDHPR